MKNPIEHSPSRARRLLALLVVVVAIAGIAIWRLLSSGAIDVRLPVNGVVPLNGVPVELYTPSPTSSAPSPTPKPTPKPTLTAPPIDGVNTIPPNGG